MVRDLGSKVRGGDQGQAAVCEFSDGCSGFRRKVDTGRLDKAQKTVRTANTVELTAVGVMHFASQKEVKHRE